MTTPHLSNGEWKLMNLLWENAPMTIAQMVTLLREDTGWSKSTVFMMLKRLRERNIVSVDENGRSQKYSPLIAREQATAAETKSFLSRVYGGSLGMMVASMAGQNALSEEDIEDLYDILQKAEQEMKP